MPLPCAGQVWFHVDGQPNFAEAQDECEVLHCEATTGQWVLRRLATGAILRVNDLAPWAGWYCAKDAPTHALMNSRAWEVYPPYSAAEVASSATVLSDAAPLLLAHDYRTPLRCGVVAPSTGPLATSSIDVGGVGLPATSKRRLAGLVRRVAYWMRGVGKALWRG